MKLLSRRALLTAGTIATAGAGAVAMGECGRGRRWLHGVGLLDGPDLTPPDVAVEVDDLQLQSRHLGGSVRWAVASPPGAPAALLVCLHGRGGDHRTAFDTIGVHRFVAERSLPWVVVGVAGGGASYWHPRADGTDARAMVFDELLPEVETRFGRLPLGLLGWSMGGFGALSAATTHQTRIGAVVAASPALWRSFSRAAPGAFDSPADFAAHDVFGQLEHLRRLPVRIDCGNDDPFAPVARQLADALPAAGAAFGPGFHDSAFWRSRVPDQLTFLEQALRR